MFPKYVVLRLFCGYSILVQYVHVMLFAMLNVLYFYISNFLNICAVSSMAVVVPEGKLCRTRSIIRTRTFSSFCKIFRSIKDYNITVQ